MKLATLPSSPLSVPHDPVGSDGCLIVVSADLRRAVDASGVAPSLADALSRWQEAEPELRALSDGLERGELVGFGFDLGVALAPLPRAPQCLVGSAFATHRRLQASRSGESQSWYPSPAPFPSVMRDASDHFRSPTADLTGYRVADDIDFGGGFGVIVDHVPRGTTPAVAAHHIKLVVLLNDVRLRAHDAGAATSDSGSVEAAPFTAFAPVAITPDELGPAWDGCRVHRRLLVAVNGQWFGHPDGAGMTHGFHELVATCAHTRDLSAGTVVASVPVSDPDPAVGTACILDRRAWEQLDRGEPTTRFLEFGDRVRLHVEDDRGRSIFGPIDQVCQPVAVR